MDLKDLIVTALAAKAFKKSKEKPTVIHGKDGKDGASIKGDQGEKGDSIVGPKGDKGDPGESIVGPKGDKGQDGLDGVSIIKVFVQDKDLIIHLSNGTITNLGPIIFDPIEGLPGKDGVSVVNASLNNGDLILSLSDGRDINVGRVVGEPGAKGEKGDKPNHEWRDTLLRFEKPDGSWGSWVDLKGPPGKETVVRSYGGGTSSTVVQKLSVSKAGVVINPTVQSINFTGDVSVTKTSGTQVDVHVSSGGGGGSGFNVQVVSTATSLQSFTLYIVQGNLPVDLTLPPSAQLGDTIKIMGLGDGGFKINQLANHIIHFGKRSTSLGELGYISSVQPKSVIEVVCVDENIGWMVSSSIGNFIMN